VLQYTFLESKKTMATIVLFTLTLLSVLSVGQMAPRMDSTTVALCENNGCKKGDCIPPPASTKFSDNSQYKYCCKTKGQAPVKTNIKTAGNATSDADIQRGRGQVIAQLNQRFADLPDGCFPKPSGIYCCQQQS